MSSTGITFTTFEAKYHARPISRRAKREPGFLTHLVRFAFPFILLDFLALGCALFLNALNTEQGSAPERIFWLYCTSMIGLAVIQRGAWHGGGSWRACLGWIFGTLGLIIALGLTVLGWLGGIWLPSFMVAGGLMFIINFIVLPALHLGALAWRRYTAPVRLQTSEILVKLGGSLVLLSLCGYSIGIEPQILRVERVEIKSAKVTADLTILHLSDIQVRKVGAFEERLFRRIRELNPDLIVDTGDLLHSANIPEQEIHRFAQRLHGLKPKYGIYAVVGNHEYGAWSKYPWFEAEAGMKFLENADVFVPTAAGQLRLFGLTLSQSWWQRDPARIATWRNAIGNDEFTVVMGHAPDFIPDLLDLDLDLCLAGHLHGTQVRLPFIGAIPWAYEKMMAEMGEELPRAWSMGYHEAGKIRLNVSGGIGTDAYIRLNCPPSMTLLTIKKS